MRHYGWLIAGVFVVSALCGLGCAKTARSTAGFALENSTTVDASFTDAWQIVKGVLREQKFDIYTRDKRGTFVAYSKMKRFLLLQPYRTQYTVELAAVNEGSTRIYVRTVKQLYGVTLLTYPGWHDRRTTDNRAAIALLEAVRSKVAERTAQKEAPAKQS
jgi:hypothetical protein